VSVSHHQPDAVRPEALQLHPSQAVHDGVAGHLATVTSAAETSFIVAHVPDAVVFRTNQGPFAGGAYIGAFQPAGPTEPGGGWQWVTGEPFVYTNWAGGAPNNAGNENVIHFWSPAGTWNDAGGSLLKGYLVEYDAPSGGQTKAEFLQGSGVGGKGISDASGLQKEFNPKSKAAERAGKK